MWWHAVSRFLSICTSFIFFINLKIAIMLGTNIFSDSQESALMDDETFKDIEDTFGGSLPLKPEDMNEFDILEEKPDIFTKPEEISAKKNIKRQREEDEHYYPAVYNDYLGCQLNFQFTFGDSGGQDWVYSEASKKLYIKMEKVLPLRFTWEPAASVGLFLRTELVFLLDEHKSDPVRRCYNHAASTYHVNQNMTSDRINHVVHCVNHLCFYKEKDEHLSVLTPLGPPEAGSQYFPMCYKFLCKNSCTSGMNRRATELVFTLENERNQILARRTMAIRICSCPKRDMQKAEREELNEQESVSIKRKHVLTPNKKLSSCDKHVYKVELNVVGKENFLAVYKYAYDVMAGQAAKTGQHEIFKPYMDDILSKIP